MVRAEIVQDLEFYKIHTSRVIQAGEELQVHMSFAAPLTNSQSGMYWSDYPEDGQTKYVLITRGNSLFKVSFWSDQVGCIFPTSTSS